MYLAYAEAVMHKDQHVIRRGVHLWAVRGAGNSRDTSLHPTQVAAQLAARAISRNQKSNVLVHGINGQIRQRISYGHSSFPSKS